MRICRQLSRQLAKNPVGPTQQKLHGDKRRNAECGSYKRTHRWIALSGFADSRNAIVPKSIVHAGLQ
jgi:hypothetical protein